MLNLNEHEIFAAHNVKMPAIVGILTLIVGILTFMSRKISILGLSGPKKVNFYTYDHLKFHTELS